MVQFSGSTIKESRKPAGIRVCNGKEHLPPAGFEPATGGLEIRCSVHLSYGGKSWKSNELRYEPCNALPPLDTHADILKRRKAEDRRLQPSTWHSNHSTKGNVARFDPYSTTAAPSSKSAQFHPNFSFFPAAVPR